MKNLREVDLKDKKVLLRVDFDVPVSEGKISEQFRIEKQKETLDYLLQSGAKVILVSHISAEESFGGLIPQLHLILGHEINFLKKIEDIPEYLDSYAGPALLENIRSFPGEKENDENFASKLAGNFDIYINNAFAVCHRNQASVSAVAKHLPSYAGFLIEEETSKLKSVVEAPKEGKIIIMGGAKASTKIPAIKNLIDKSEKILIGGVIANDIVKKKGEDVGDSVVDDNLDELFVGVDINDPRLVIPADFVRVDNRMPDIGPKSSEEFAGYISAAKLVVWNGPMGIFEDDRFLAGTKKVAEAVASSPAGSVIGGGDTIAAVNKLGLLGKFGFVSTGGGAMLAFLAGDKLPGLEVLGYYK